MITTHRALCCATGFQHPPPARMPICQKQICCGLNSRGSLYLGSRAARCNSAACTTARASAPTRVPRLASALSLKHTQECFNLACGCRYMDFGKCNGRVQHGAVRRREACTWCEAGATRACVHAQQHCRAACSMCLTAHPVMVVPSRGFPSTITSTAVLTSFAIRSLRLLIQGLKLICLLGGSYTRRNPSLLFAPSGGCVPDAE